MSLPPLPGSAISLNEHAGDWRAAVTLAGDALVRSGATSAGYTGRMIDVIEEFGPYVVIAPGLALVHARPGTDVSSEGLSVVTLDEPVSFGHPHNDPVTVLIGLASVTSDNHVTSVADLANVFNDATAVPRLAAAGTADEVRAMFGIGKEAQ